MDSSIASLNSLLYFAIPENSNLLAYWDKVADRLFKIRHCMNIEGIVRQLPLFEPPIDPGLLVKAAAAGVDLSSALYDLSVSKPEYRFQYLIQKAVELSNDVKSLGAQLLSVLEKRDAEKLALMRSSHEEQALKAMRQIKQLSIRESKQSLKSLEHAREITQIKHDYYSTREFMSASEQAHIITQTIASYFQLISQQVQASASTVKYFPDYAFGGAGIYGTPLFITFVGGGEKTGGALQAFGAAMSMYASQLNTMASLSSIMGSYERRAQEWKFQDEMAEKEIEQVEKQLIGSQIRLAMAEKNLQNHDLQIENAEEVKVFMSDKYTNQELYDWMVTQISNTYFQSYNLAYEMAKKAEKSFQYELARYDTSFIEFGYWDSLKKGLLSGEKLYYDLKRLESAYIDNNKRENEITKHISLAMLSPEALLSLKEAGSCLFEIPEYVYDLDFAGHYLRRIKSVSLSIPCVTGPYTSVNCTLSLVSNRLRLNTQIDADAGLGYEEVGESDPRFRYEVGAIQSIATSDGQSDTGMFEFSFRDERYLPFEGAGAISSWRLEMPDEFRSFDYDSISDVILHINYTSRSANLDFKDKVELYLADKLSTENTLFSLISAKHGFNQEWHQFITASSIHDGFFYLAINIDKKYFPHIFHYQKDINIHHLTFFLIPKDGLSSAELLPLSFDYSDNLDEPNNGENTFSLLEQNEEDNRVKQCIPFCEIDGVTINDRYYFKIDDENIETLQKLEDIVILVNYSVSGD